MTDDLKLADDVSDLVRRLLEDAANVCVECGAPSRERLLKEAATALRTRHQTAEIARRAMREEAARVCAKLKAQSDAAYNAERDPDAAKRELYYGNGVATALIAIRALPAPLDVEAMVERATWAVCAQGDGGGKGICAEPKVCCEPIARAVLFSIIGEGNG